MNMEDTRERISMGPALVSLGTHSLDEPPKFRTSHTNKVEHWEELSTWVSIARISALLYSKAKAKLYIIGLLIYQACDKTAKDMLRKEETRGNLNLKGRADD